MNEKTKKLIEKYSSKLSNYNDLLAGEKPSILFNFLLSNYGYLLNDNPNEVLSIKGMKFRKVLHPLIQTLGPFFLKNRQKIENRTFLINNSSNACDIGPRIPSEPVIFVANHAFKDDTLASVLAAKRHSYILFGSLPQFYNTFDGVLSWLNGVVMVNRKMKSSKSSVVDKCKKVLDAGTSILMFPEGVWNKEPSKLILDLWPGVYDISKKTGCKVVPIVHYISDLTQTTKSNIIHTVVDEPINISSMEKRDALIYLRDKLASWYYLMMENYGKSTRKKEFQNYDNFNDVWDNSLKNRVSGVCRYDKEIELIADYRPKNIIRPEEVFLPISNIDVTVNNVNDVLYSKKLVKVKKLEDFQRRF